MSSSISYPTHPRRAASASATAPATAAETLPAPASRRDAADQAGREARLAVNGCASLLDPTLPYAIVFDIGGGSTELVWLRLPADPAGEPEILGVVSLPFGVVTFTERYGGDVIAGEDYEAMVGEALAAIAEFARRHDIAAVVAGGGVQMLGSSGTVTTLAGIHLGLPRYNRHIVDGSTLLFDDIMPVFEAP